MTDATHGVLFDIDGDGNREQIPWTARGSDLAFLAIDRNGNGIIDNGSELFGNYTLPEAGDGFRALYLMASKVAGSDPTSDLTAEHPLWPKLLLWTDDNHDGVSQASELLPASKVLSRIGLGYAIDLKVDATGKAILDSAGLQIMDIRADTFGNVFKFRGWVEYRDEQFGKTAGDRLRSVYEVILAANDRRE